MSEEVNQLAYYEHGSFRFFERICIKMFPERFFVCPQVYLCLISPIFLEAIHFWASFFGGENFPVVGTSHATIDLAGLATNIVLCELNPSTEKMSSS